MLRIARTASAMRRLPPAPVLRTLGRCMCAQTDRARAAADEPRIAEPVRDVVISFLGTGAGVTAARSQHSVLVWLQPYNDLWLFDCGEGTSRQLLRAGHSCVDVTKIFISSLRSSKLYGLPGLLLQASYEARQRIVHQAHSPRATPAITRRPVELVGPAGLRAWLRASLGLEFETLEGTTFRVHELGPIDELRMHSSESGTDSAGAEVRTGPDAAAEEGGRAGAEAWAASRLHVAPPHAAELAGQQLRSASRGVWMVPPPAEGEPPFRVCAVALDATTPSVGWVLEEPLRPGKMRAQGLLPLLARHGLPPKTLRLLKAGIPIDLPDGETLRPEDYLEPPTRRRDEMHRREMRPPR